MDYVYLGGEIVNPTSKFIILSKNGSFIDTIRLNERNRFNYKLENAESGLYLLKHEPETQSVFLNPGDSLLIRVNTLAFDESLHFSGKGDVKNNFLADMFLLDKKNTDLLLDFHKIDPTTFSKKVDSIAQERLGSLEAISEKKKLPENFQEIAKEIIKYESYDLKERYTYLVHKYYKTFYKEIPSGFHDYRQNVDFNNEPLQCNSAYNRFINNYLSNHALQWCKQSNLDKEDCSETTNIHNVTARIEKAGELIQLPALREEILSKIAVQGIVMAKNSEDIEKVLNLLQEKQLEKEKYESLKELGAIQLAYLPGTSLNKVPLINTQGDTLISGKQYKKPTIAFLWSMYEDGHSEDHRLVQMFRKKYPEVDFWGINLDVSEVEKWKRTVQKFGYDPSKEFQLTTLNIDKVFFDYYLNKTLFISASGKVIYGDAFLDSPEFESRILEFLNR